MSEYPAGELSLSFFVKEGCVWLRAPLSFVARVSEEDMMGSTGPINRENDFSPRVHKEIGSDILH
jgi:hypothetical protein